MHVLPSTATSSFTVDQQQIVGLQDFWGWPGERVIFGCSFYHLTPGWVSLTVGAAGSHPMPSCAVNMSMPCYNASAGCPPRGSTLPPLSGCHSRVVAEQRLWDGQLSGDVRNTHTGFGLTLHSAHVLASLDAAGAPHSKNGRNTVLLNVTATCPPGVQTAEVTTNVSSSCDGGDSVNCWRLPVQAHSYEKSGEVSVPQTNGATGVADDADGSLLCRWRLRSPTR